MKRIVVLVAGLVLIFTFSSMLRAQDPLAEKVIAEKKAEINNIEWTVAVKKAGTGGRSEIDTLTFSDNKFSSANLAREGFAPTGFNLTVAEEGSARWGAMQSDDKGNFIFWSGEIFRGVIHGIVSRQNAKGKRTDFSFASQN